MEGGEEGGLGMRKATGGKTQHGKPFLPPTIRALLSAEHSVQAGVETALPAQTPPPQGSHSQSGTSTMGHAQEQAALGKGGSKCQVLQRLEGVISIE